MRGLLPADVKVVSRRRASPIPEAVRREIDRLKALYEGFHDRELARILLIKIRGAHRPQHGGGDVARQSVSVQGWLDFLDYHPYDDRSQARLQVIKLYFQDWNKGSTSQIGRAHV